MKIAIPNKGRLAEPALRMLERAGVRAEQQERRLFSATSIGNVQVLFARAADIPRYVESGSADAGITGLDLVAETGCRVPVLLKLAFGRCRVVLAVPQDSAARKPGDLKGARIATKLPNIAGDYIKRKKLHAKITVVDGATEITPYLGVADAIIDHVSTGATLEMNRLRAIDTLLESQACLVARRSTPEVRELRTALEGVLLAEGKKYVMCDVSKAALKRVLAVMPAMESPTVLNLANGGYAVHSVVAEAELLRVVSELKRAGATAILVLPIERMLP